eukprot:g20688.t1
MCVCVRAPEEGLPTVDEEPGGELMQILRSAYGLVESPRLWYLRASKLLTLTPLNEMPISKSSFVASDDPQAWALLSLHVDDGLLFGSEQDERFKKLKKDINGMFTIKEKTIPLTFLGVDLKEQQGELYDDMSNYFNKISLPDLKPSAKNDTPLNPQQLTSYRQLVMSLRWPGQQSMPQLFGLRKRQSTSAAPFVLSPYSLRSSQVIIDLRCDLVDSEAEIVPWIARQHPWTMSWSNVLDYMPPQKFHQLARMCSLQGDTIHYGYSMNWICEVYGSCIMDYDKQPQVGVASMQTYNPLATTASCLSMTWTYDPDIRLQAHDDGRFLDDETKDLVNCPVS